MYLEACGWLVNEALETRPMLKATFRNRVRPPVGDVEAAVDGGDHDEA